MVSLTMYETKHNKKGSKQTRNDKVLEKKIVFMTMTAADGQ